MFLGGAEREKRNVFRDRCIKLNLILLAMIKCGIKK